MSSSVESRIVSMKFDNKDFEKGVSTTLSSLGTLSKTLDAGFTAKAAGGLSRIGQAIRGFSFGNMGAQVDGISGKFVALSTVAVTALARITNSAITTATTFLKQFSGIDAMQQGFAEYETKMGSIQAILANTSGEGLDDVSRALEELNRYSDKTIYNFGEMVTNIKTFTVAGIDLDTSVASVKGLANVAALTGTNASEAAHATYQMAQAMSSGAVRLQDWISMEKAGGMAGKVFQDSLLRTARNHGVAVDEMIEQNGSFRLSLSEGWLSTEILNETLGQWAGAYDKAKLQQMGYTEAQATAIIKLQKQAEASATDVKTFSALVSTIQETMASGWAKTFEIVFGDLKEATKLWTALNDVVGGFFSEQAKQRNKMLQGWADAGGRTALFEGLGNIFQALGAIIEPIIKAFRNIFPPATGKQVASITKAFRDFTESLIISRETGRHIRDIFEAIFTVVKVGAVVIGGVIKYIAEFFGIIITGGGGEVVQSLLGIVAMIGRVVTAIGDWLFEGARLEDFFDVIIQARNEVLEPLVGVIANIITALLSLAQGDVSGFFSNLGDSGDALMDLFDTIVEKVVSLGTTLGGVFQSVAAVVDNFFGNLGAGGAGAFTATIDYISEAIDNLRSKLSFGGGEGLSLDTSGIDAVGDQVQELSWIAEAAGKVWSGLTAVVSGVAGVLGPIATWLFDFFGAIGEKVLAFVETMTMQDLVQIINTGVFVLLYRALTNLANMTGGLLGFGDAATGAFNKLTGALGTMQNALRVNMIFTLALAVALLAGALIALSFVPEDKLAGALGAITALMAQVGAMMFALTKISIAGGGLFGLAAMMISLAFAILIMAGALKVLENVSWGSIAKMAVTLQLMVMPLKLIGSLPHLAAAGIGLAALSVGMVAMATALLIMENVDWGAIFKMGLALTFMALALAGVGAVGPAVIAGGLAMLLAAPALVVMTGALLLMEQVDWSAIVKLGVALLSISAAMLSMLLALPGALALVTVVGALTLLLPVMLAFSAMDWSTFAKSLGMIVLAIVTLGAVGAVMGLLSPLIAAFGIALMTVGVAMMLVGGGALLLSLGLAGVAASGAAAFAVLASGVTMFLSLLPQWIIQFGQALNQIIVLINSHGPPFMKAMGRVFRAMLNEARKSIGPFGRLVQALIEEGLRVIRATADDWAKAAFKCLMAFMNELDKNMDEIADKGADIIVKFLKGIERNDDRIARQGRETIVSLSKAMSREILKLVTDVFGWTIDIGVALINGIRTGIGNAWSSVTSYLQEKANSLPKALKIAWGINSPSRVFADIAVGIPEGIAKGIREGGDVDRALEEVAGRAVGGLRATMSRLADVSSDDLSFDPTITPVLDLSEVRKESTKLAGLLTAPALMGGVSLAEALSVSNEMAAQNGQNGGKSEKESGGDTTFIQNINSPKAVSHVEVYRGTKNLLALKRRELGITS